MTYNETQHNNNKSSTKDNIKKNVAISPNMLNVIKFSAFMPDCRDTEKACHGHTREILLKGKAQYGSPPFTN